MRRKCIVVKRRTHSVNLSKEGGRVCARESWPEELMSEKRDVKGWCKVRRRLLVRGEKDIFAA